MMKPSDTQFYHPYEPYDIQLEFMKGLYDCIQQGNVGIFESPTGTGKSLSLICGALTWLRDHKRRTLEGELGDTTADPNDWLALAEKNNRRKARLRDLEEFEEQLMSARRIEERSKVRTAGPRPSKRLKAEKSNAANDEEEYLLEDYESDNDGQLAAGKHDGLSAETRALLDKLQPLKSADETMVPADEIKLIFCSRTHSQLTQFVNELRRVKPPRATPTDDGSDKPSAPIRHLPLGSRKNMCINDKVSSLKSTTAMNERCLELQKPGTSKEKKCQYLPTKENRHVVESFRGRAIARIRDIEDIADLGKQMEVCPYYASRSAIAPSEVVTLPYPLLLQKSAREALGVSVQENVVIIDEAHNLLDAIADTFSTAMRLTQLQMVSQQVTAYVQRFKNKLKGKNRVYITQIIRLLNSITDCLDKIGTTIKQQDIHVSAAQLMAGKGVDQVKPHKLLHYIHESKLAYKIEGYTELQKEGQDSTQHRGLLMLFQSLLAALMNPDAEGRFFASKLEGDVVIRYTLLDPREHFRDIVQDARSVILAGGTMSPMSDYADHLFAYLPPANVQTFSFGHVIPKENMFAQPVTIGPVGVTFDFTFDKRGSESIINELGGLLVRVTAIVPDGVVVFFPSYDYLAQVVKGWQQIKAGKSVMNTLRANKTVFEESKGVAAEELLREYSQAVDAGKGALLLSVIGGKLSEGINFSDRLGRAVVCVGLPFPNANGGEWKAKIEYIEKKKLEQGREHGISSSEGQSRARAAGRDFYENACMRAVNQSIGRAIRHRNDYAAILLVDRRFATDRIRRKLPGWIRDSMPEQNSAFSWQQSEVALRDFFKNK